MTQIDPDIGPITNNEILCPHGLATLDIKKMKRISEVAWDYLYEKFGADVVLSNEKCCEACVSDDFYTQKISSNLEDEKKKKL